MYKKYYTGDNRARFISTLFPREFADTDIATIKNFKVEPLKTLIPIDEPENGRLVSIILRIMCRRSGFKPVFRVITIITTNSQNS